VAAKLLESPQAVKMDNLTVTRLRTECRLRRLPVSGRKRNLVLRLLPFADAILGGSSGNAAAASTEERDAAAAASRDLAAAAAVAGVTHVMTRAPATTTDDDCRPQPTAAAAAAEFHPPFVPLDAFISGGWSNVDGDDWTSERAAADELDRSRHALTAADGRRLTVVDHVEQHRRVDVGGPPSSEADADGDDDEGESLVCRWLRQQRLIDELRHELCRYRRALAAARLQTPAGSAVDVDDDRASAVRLFDDIGVDAVDEIARYSTAVSYFASKRYTELYGCHF